MDIKREEMLEKLRQVKNTASQNLKEQEGYENSVVQNVNYYGIIELFNKETNKKEQHELYTVEIYDYETDQLSTRIYLDGQEIDIGEILRTYESIQPIKDEINKAKENEKESDVEEDKVYKLNELEKEKTEEIKENKDDKEIINEEEVNDLQISNAQGKIDLNQMVDGRTLRNIMGLDGDDVYIAPVDSSRLNLEGTNAKETFVALKSDGRARILYDDIIKEDRQEGTSPTNQDIFVGNDGEVEKRSAISNYIITGTNYSLSIYHDDGTSSRATTITKRSGREGVEGEVDIELHHQGDQRIDDDTRNALREKNGKGESDEMKNRQEKHENNNCKNDRIENIDNNKNNDLHFHITEEQLEELAENTNESKDVLKDRFERETEKNPDKSVEEIIDIIEDDYERLQKHEHE